MCVGVQDIFYIRLFDAFMSNMCLWPYHDNLYTGTFDMKWNLCLKLIIQLSFNQFAWVNVFRIFPEFRILRLTFSLKMLNQADYNGCPGLLAGYLQTFDHQNLKLLILCRHTASFKF